jgi:Uma2 family endonuclease
LALPLPIYQTATVNLSTDLWLYLKANPIGRVYAGATPFVLKDSPMTLRGPDVAIILNAHPGRVHPDEIIRGAPDIAIDVAAPRNRVVAEYLEAGASEVWLVYPDAREIHIYSQTNPLRLLRKTDTLTSETLPGFSIPVASVFA